MKFFNTTQIRELDLLTIEQEPIASIDLMERAARAIYIDILRKVEADTSVLVAAGPGNNGGDALALARMLLKSSLSVQVILLHNGKLSTDCETNRQRLIDKFPTSLIEQTASFEAPNIVENTIIIDGLFGSGLTRPLSGIYAEAVKWINKGKRKVISIDIPSGLQGEEIPLAPKGEQELQRLPIVMADTTLSLQFPKLAFLMPENAEFVGNWRVLDIGIHHKAIQSTPSNLYFLETADIVPMLKTRSKFTHKGTFGHALIIAGSKGMAGASVLCSKAALRSGAGLVTVHGPECNRTIVQTVVPEIIFQSDKDENYITEVSQVEAFNSIAIGPGMSTNMRSIYFLQKFIKTAKKPCVLDADALNIISLYKELPVFIPTGSIITPHPKEFDRLFGLHSNSYDRILKASEKAQRLGIIIILKGAHTLIAMPDGKMFFNNTGNTGMATAGSGDVLTGILTGLMAQGYSSEESAKLGVYIHGLAGNLALKVQSEESLIASDILSCIGEAFRTLKS